MLDRTECTRIYDDETLRTLAQASDWEGIIDHCCGSPGADYATMWSLAMNANYGPTGIHASRLSDRGTPDASKCGDCPQVFDGMHQAQLRILQWMKILSATTGASGGTA